VFDWPQDAEQWLVQCAGHDPVTTLRQLRVFLADHCLEHYNLHRMNDRQVIKAAARRICLNLHRIVIEPRLGWAVQVDPLTQEPTLPISVEPEPDVSSLFNELQQDLNALVADQQKNYDQWEKKLAAMDEAERALLYSQNAGGGLYDSVVGDTVDTVVAVAKGFPGFLKGYWKTLKKVAQAPAKIAEVTAEAITTGSLNPFKREIDKIVTPIADTYEKAMEYKSMLTIIFNEPELYGMLHNFAERYWAATHPVERTRMAASAVSDVVVTVILAIFTVGAGAAANIAAKSAKLAKVARMLKKITSVLKRVSPGSAKFARKLSNAEKAVDKAGDAGSAAKKAKKLAPDKKPKSSEVLDDGPKKEYGKNKDKDGPKTTAKAAFGESTSNNYKKTFFKEHPDLEGDVVVHHAVEQQTLKRYPDVVTESEMHSLENLRGIPKDVNSDVHLSKIRKEWNRFYKQNANPTKQQLLDKATEIDQKFGSQFKPSID
jgi:hypothetical protein